jgi:hypothetical protein
MSLPKYEMFENPSGLTKEQIKFLNTYTHGSWKLKDGLINITGSLRCSGLLLASMLDIKFGKVTEDFNISENKFTSLKGMPTTVGGSFNCSSNKLTSLKGSPNSVGEGFICTYNNITSLKGMSSYVGGSVFCYNNRLTTLEGAPKDIEKSFDCSNNELISLSGSPKNIGRNFNCSFNQLTTLAGAPDRINDTFDCSYNQLVSFEGAPRFIGGELSCDHNRISEKTLMMIYDKMEASNVDYKKSLASFIMDIPSDDLEVMDIEDLGFEEDLLRKIKSYIKIKNMI